MSEQDLKILRRIYFKQKKVYDKMEDKIYSTALLLVPSFVLTLTSSLFGIALIIQEVNMLYVFISFLVSVLSIIFAITTTASLVTKVKNANMQWEYLHDIAGDIEEMELPESHTEKIQR